MVRTVIRPSTGKSYEVKFTQPVVDLKEQNARHEDYFRHGGDLGNLDHLWGKGDHTPWSEGKLPGWIYAKDTFCPRDFEEWIVKKCKSDYDTTWIDFFNIDYSQYDNAGNRLQSSGDGHFHVSVAKGFEHKHVTLFDDYVREKEGDDMPTVKEFFDYHIASPALKRDHPFSEWVKSIGSAAVGVENLTALVVAANAADETRDRTTLAAIAALTDALKAGTGASVDAAAIVAAIHDEGERTRREVSDRATALLVKTAEALKEAAAS